MLLAEGGHQFWLTAEAGVTGGAFSVTESGSKSFASWEISRQIRLSRRRSGRASRKSTTPAS